MNTLYDLFKVNESASQDEIKNAYEKIIMKADSLPQTDKLIEKVQRIKIAYGILSDPEKRKKYDEDLSIKRANELLENVQVKEEKNEQVKAEKSVEIKKEKPLKTENENSVKPVQELKNQPREEKLKKELKKLERKNRKKAKKEQQLQREKEIQAYGSYLSSQGYKIKYPWTWIRVKKLLISIIVVIFTLIILWHIPFVKNALTNLYNDNFLIKWVVNAIISIWDSIISTIKGAFK